VFLNVTEHERHTGDFALVIADRGGAVVRRSFDTIPGDEEGVVCQVDDLAIE
jgi:hypothetical protein